MSTIINSINLSLNINSARKKNKTVFNRKLTKQLGKYICGYIWINSSLKRRFRVKKMKVYAIVLIVCGCVFAALIILCCLRKGWDRKKKQSRPPTSMRSVAVPSDKRANYVERGGASKSSGNTKDGKMVILAGLELLWIPQLKLIA